MRSLERRSNSIRQLVEAIQELRSAPEKPLASDTGNLTGTTVIDVDTENDKNSIITGSPAVISDEESKTESDLAILKVIKKVRAESRRKKGGESAPAKSQDDEDYGSDIDETGTKWISDFVKSRADEISANQLFEIYSRKLEVEDGKRQKKKKKVEKAPQLVKNFADYLRTLESRIGQLESKLAKKGDHPGDEEGIIPPPPPPPPSDASIETAFYNSANFANIDFIDQCSDLSWQYTGTFTSEVDRIHFLRVLYKADGGQKKQPGIPPAGDVEVLALRLNSSPVAAFLEMLTSDKLSRFGLMLMVKPFRVLVRHVSDIKNQLNRLQEKARQVTSSRRLDWSLIFRAAYP